jgi:hypothetical protein
VSAATKKNWIIALGLLLVAGAILGLFAWYKFFREEPQPPFASEEEWFKYGSLGGENDQGVPYWIWVVLPRVFPDLMPGAGGYKSLGLVWEEGAELPVGFSKKTVGFPRVGNNCALCHTAAWRSKSDETPKLVLGAPANTINVQQLLQFFSRAAGDARFNSGTILNEIAELTKLSWVDQQLYRFLIIPLTRKAFLEQGQKFAWATRPGKPAWGVGRDDPFNMAKYFMTSLREDNTVGQSDFGSCWNLAIRKGTNLLLNWAGETPSVYSVLVDSSLGVGARPGGRFEENMRRLDQFLSRLPAPKCPFTNGPHAINPQLAATGEAIYKQHCAACHEPGREKTNRVIPLDEIGTDRERFDSWSQAAADQMNATIKHRGVERPGVIKNNGYLSPPLDGLWARAPYLHNGSVPNLRELLETPSRRSKGFFRGYDIYDPSNIGFTTKGAEAERTGFWLDTTLRGNANHGHTYGTEISAEEKTALLEFLKTL